MCSIFGVIIGNGDIDFDFIEKLSLSMAHRGPDAHGSFYSSCKSDFGKGDVALYHNRLAIIDLTEYGAQPMQDASNSLCIVFNGEIYNYLELREELVGYGYVFKGGSDTEVLLNCYAHWGKDCLSRLEGMFSFCIYDKKKDIVFLARDRFGIKPLYYSLFKENIYFSSEIAPLLKIQNGNIRQNIPEIISFLQSGITDSGRNTCFQNIYAIEAAEYAVVNCQHSDRVVTNRYWRPIIGSSDISRSDAALKLKNIFFNSIDQQLRSDVPIGALLSGGMDSSSIVMAIHSLQSNLKLNTFSFVPSSNLEISERHWIDIVNSESHSKENIISINDEEIIPIIKRTIQCQEQPFGSTSIIAQNKLFSFVNVSKIKVVLDGQGADEIFGGYKVLVATRLADLIKNGNFIAAVRFMKSSRAFQGRENLLLHCVAQILPNKIAIPFKQFLINKFSQYWIKSEYRGFQNPYLASINQSVGAVNLKSALYSALSQSSLPMLLRYEDRNSMRYSVESRLPFLNRDIVEFAFTLPDEFLIDESSQTKSILRDSMYGIVPSAVSQRKNKVAFATPELDWLSKSSTWISEILHSDNQALVPYIDLKMARDYWERTSRSNKSIRFEMWRIISTILWAKEFSASV
jgi:asparagine synthase (glutamine-hydrolysing)